MGRCESDPEEECPTDPSNGRGPAMIDGAGAGTGAEEAGNMEGTTAPVGCVVTVAGSMKTTWLSLIGRIEGR